MLEPLAIDPYPSRVIRPEQCRAARALLGWSQVKLAEEAGVRVLVVRRFETGKTDPRASTLARIETALTKAGIEFSDDGGVGVRLQKRP